MYHKKTEKQLQDVVVESYYTCDKCEERIQSKLYDAFDFDFELKTGSAYPSSGDVKKQIMDLCNACADELVERLKSDGYNIRTEEWDY